MNKEKEDQFNKISNETRRILALAYDKILTKIIIVISVIGGLPFLWSLLDLFDVSKLMRLLFSVVVYIMLFLIVAIVTVIKAFRSLTRKVAEMGDVSQYETHHYLALLDAKYFGLQRKIYTITSYIFNDGSCNSKHGTQLLAHADHIDKIEHRQSALSTPEESEQIIINAEEKYSDEIRIIPHIKRQTHTTCYWELSFIPALKKGKELKYSYEVKLAAGAFAMNYKTLSDRCLSFEYAATQISYPTEHFQRKVIFPKDFIPASMGYDVWLGDAQVRHTKEFIRVEQEHFFRKGVEDDCLYIELHIIHPIHGLKYVLTWVPK